MTATSSATADWSEVLRVVERVIPVVVGSHPRSGTHLTIDFLRLNFPQVGGWKLPLEPLNYLYVSLDALAEPNPLFRPTYVRTVLSRSDNPIIKTHSLHPDLTDVTFFGQVSKQLPEDLRQAVIARSRQIYVFRNCNDVLVSFQQWMQGFNRDARVPMHEFLEQRPQGELNRVEQWVRHVESWLDHPQVMAIRFQDLVGSPQAVAKRISQEWDWELASSIRLPAKATYWSGRRSRLFGWRPQSTAILGRSNSENSKPHLDPRAAAVVERYAGQLLARLETIPRIKD